ncbi:RluA family pseudouridine synthase [Floccifex sp.]|uniref:RluA family pseudouridine synthase n=1 Tax=Floccifex sp. TaxID=2815810 RepID=UPI003F0087E9
MKEITIQKNDANQRLDKFLQKSFPFLSKAMMYKAIRNKKIKINRKRCEFNQILQENDQILLFLPDDCLIQKERNIEKEKPLSIVYEDNNYLIVNKEYGLLSQSDQKGNQDCLVSRIQSYLFYKNEYNPEQENSFAPAICNRLDRNTTGLVIAAKNAKSLKEMNEQIACGNVHKFYRARVDGKLKGKGKIHLYIKKEGTKALACKQKKEGYKEALLYYQVIQEFENETIVNIELKTGRFHQIRVSFSSIGHPLIGDTKYGYKGKKKKIELKAYQLIFDKLYLPNIQIE